MNFSINGTTLSVANTSFPFKIDSYPRPYTVTVINNLREYKEYVSDADFIVIDSNIESLYTAKVSDNTTICSINACEENKNMEQVLKIIDLMIENKISKGSNVLAIGGGIIQDLAACACALFRRGQPFIYMPTTTLGQLDSCVGAKCAVNTKKAKNILGLFSAPSKVVIPSFMIKTMGLKDHRAGLAEMLRLCLTASTEATHSYINILEHISDPQSIDIVKYEEALCSSLSIKRAVVEYDEYEKDVRRSMNYGHTFGHAIEKLTDFSIPHGLAVLLGILMSNEYSVNLGKMTLKTKSLTDEAIQITLSGLDLPGFDLKELRPCEMIEQFQFDKKGDGKSVPIIMIEKPGNMFFYRHFFDSDSDLLISSIRNAIKKWSNWCA